MQIEEAKDILEEICNRPIQDTEGTKIMKEAIDTVLNELKEQTEANKELNKVLITFKAMINEMAKEIEERLGTCPYDEYDWQDIDCGKVCEDNMKECWKEYFYKKVE